MMCVGAGACKLARAAAGIPSSRSAGGGQRGRGRLCEPCRASRSVRCRQNGSDVMKPEQLRLGMVVNGSMAAGMSTGSAVSLALRVFRRQMNGYDGISRGVGPQRRRFKAPQLSAKIQA